MERIQDFILGLLFYSRDLYVLTGVVFASSGTML